MVMPICFRILGQPYSKANSRRLVTMPVKGRPGQTRAASIKSAEALAYEESAQRQIPSWARAMLEGEVCVSLKMYYPSELMDMDESLLLDILQAKYKTIDLYGGKKQRILVHRGVYVNDRQVRERHVYHFVDKANPRVDVEVRPRHAQQQDLIGGGASYQPDLLGQESGA